MAFIDFSLKTFYFLFAYTATFDFNIRSLLKKDSFNLLYVNERRINLHCRSVNFVKIESIYFQLFIQVTHYITSTIKEEAK